MLHGPNILLWLRFFMSFSILLSLTGLIKNQFKTLFFRYLLKEFFTFGILAARFEPTFPKKIKCLRDASFICNTISIYEQGRHYNVSNSFVVAVIF